MCETEDGEFNSLKGMGLHRGLVADYLRGFIASKVKRTLAEFNSDPCEPSINFAKVIFIGCLRYPVAVRFLV